VARVTGVAGTRSALPASLCPAVTSLSLASGLLSGHRPPLGPFDSWDDSMERVSLVEGNIDYVDKKWRG